MIDELYSAKLLKLAANMPHAGRLTNPHASASKVAKLCGSTVVVDLDVQDGLVSRFAQDVKACALGKPPPLCSVPMCSGQAFQSWSWPKTSFALC